jgi:hypothetical protein
MAISLCGSPQGVKRMHRTGAQVRTRSPDDRIRWTPRVEAAARELPRTALAVVRDVDVHIRKIRRSALCARLTKGWSPGISSVLTHGTARR